MARSSREPVPPRAEFRHSRWHDWYTCTECGAVVEDWQAHRTWHDGAEPEGDQAGYDLEGAVTRARAEGNAEAWFAPLVEDWRWLRAWWARRRARRAAPVPEPELGRAAAWERIDKLIERTTA